MSDGEEKRATRQSRALAEVSVSDNDTFEYNTEEDISTTDIQLTQDGFDPTLFRENTVSFFQKDGFLADQIDAHSKLLKVMQESEESLVILQEQTCMSLALNIFRLLYNISSLESMDLSFDVKFSSIPEDAELRLKFHEIFSSTSSGLSFKSKEFTNKLKIIFGLNVSISIDTFLQLCYLGTIVLGKCNQVRLGYNETAQLNVKCSNYDSNAQFSKFLSLYRKLANLKLLPFLFGNCKLVEKIGAHLKTKKYLNVRISNFLKIALVTNMHFSMIPHLWSMFDSRHTKTLNSEVAALWKSLCTKYKEILPIPSEVRPLLDEEDSMEIQKNSSRATNPSVGPVEPDHSSLAAIEVLRKSNRKRRIIHSIEDDEDGNNLVLAPESKSRIFEEKHTKLFKLLSRQKCVSYISVYCDKCNEEFESMSRIKCSICQSSYHASSMAACILDKTTTPEVEDVKDFYYPEKLPAKIFAACTTCANCTETLSGNTFSCANESCVGVFCSNCYIETESADVPDTGQFGRLINHLDDSENLVLQAMVPVLFRDNILNGINMNALHLKTPNLFEINNDSSGVYSGSIQSYVQRQLKERNSFASSVRRLDLFDEVLYKIEKISNETELLSAFKYGGPLMYISPEYVSDFNGKTVEQTLDIVASKGYLTFFHFDLDDGEKYYSIQKKGKKLWFFYPNNSSDTGVEYPNPSFREFLTHGSLCVQAEGTCITWTKHTYHAVIHLTDTVAVSGQFNP